MAKHRAITVGDVVAVTTPLGNTVVAEVKAISYSTWLGVFTDDHLVTREVTIPLLDPYTVLNRLY